MATVYLPRPLTDLFPGSLRQLDVNAATVLDVVRQLEQRWPGMLDRLCDPGPEIREHMNIFVDGEKGGLDTTLNEASIVRIIPAVSGG